MKIGGDLPGNSGNELKLYLGCTGSRSMRGFTPRSSKACQLQSNSRPCPGADLGFPIGGGADPPGGGRQHTILSNFPENCMKSRKFWALGGLVPGAPPWIRH